MNYTEFDNIRIEAQHLLRSFGKQACACELHSRGYKTTKNSRGALDFLGECVEDIKATLERSAQIYERIQQEHDALVEIHERLKKASE